MAQTQSVFFLDSSICKTPDWIELLEEKGEGPFTLTVMRRAANKRLANAEG